MINEENKLTVRRKLTENFIESLEGKEKAQIFNDEVPGLKVMVQSILDKKGNRRNIKPNEVSKGFYYSWRPKGSKPKRLFLGSTKELSRAAALRRVNEIKSKIFSGHDPILIKQSLQKELDLGALVKEFYQNRLNKNHGYKPKTIKHVKDSFRVWIFQQTTDKKCRDCFTYDIQYKKISKVTKEAIKNVHNAIGSKVLFLEVINKYLKNKKFKTKNFSFEKADLHKALIEFRKNNPKKFGEMYDTLNLSAVLKSIFYSSTFLKKFSDVLCTRKSNIYLNGFMFRLDPPHDTRNSLDWHQDSPYYQMSYPLYNSGVCWIALTNNSVKNGTLVFIPSKNPNFEKNVNSIKKNEYSSEQFKIKISTSEKKKIENLKTNSRDVAFFHMNTKHKSGINISKKFRITIVCRFHDMSKSFNVGKEVYFFNKTKKTKLF